MWVLEIKLNNSYSKIAESIGNFKWQPLKEFTGRKKQASQTGRRDSAQYDSDVILFVDPEEKVMRTWMKKIA